MISLLVCVQQSFGLRRALSVIAGFQNADSFVRKIRIYLRIMVALFTALQLYIVVITTVFISRRNQFDHKPFACCVISYAFVVVFFFKKK